MLYELSFIIAIFIFLWIFTVVVKPGGIVVGRVFIWRCNEFVISGVYKYIKEKDFF